MENTGGPVNNGKENGGETESTPVEVGHLQEEEFNDYLKILGNGLRTQILNTERKEEDIKFIFGNKRMYIDEKKYNREQNRKIIPRNFQKGKISIFSEIGDHYYNQVPKKN